MGKRLYKKGYLVVILVIMDIMYMIKVSGRTLTTVVILVIMDIMYMSGHIYPTGSMVVILVIMDIMYMLKLSK